MFAFVAIDFETTGSVPGFPNEPWQVGAVFFDERGIAHPETAVDSLLRIDAARPFNRYAPGRYATRRDALAVAPTLPDLWPQLGPLLARGPVVAHNIGTERTILSATAPLTVPYRWMDTLDLARTAWPNAPSHALEDLLGPLGLLDEARALAPGREPHDAFFDAVACGLLLVKLLSFPAWSNATPERLINGNE